MGIVRFVLWTALCFGLGIAAATVEVGGRTPWQHAAGAWKDQAPKLERVKGDAAGLVEDVKFKVAPGEGAGPKERHTKAEREAIDQIIAKRGQK
jgi:hypothetical protein